MIKSVDSKPAANHPTDGLAIEVKSLTKTYKSGIVFRKGHRALSNVTLEVNRGEIFGLLGPNGAGKTTFLKILLGIIRKSKGSAKLLGFAAGSREGRKRVGYLPEHLRVPPHLTGYQALEFFGNLSNVPTSVVRAKRGALLEQVGLVDRAKDKVNQYSKGMLQRLGLAQALLHDPQLLVMDEPTDGLDPKARAEMRQLIRDLQKQGVTIFLNSHLLQEVEMVCHRVAILDKGNLRYCGAVDEIGDFLQQQAVANGAAPDGKIAAELEMEGDVETIKKCLDEYEFDIVSNFDQQVSLRIHVPGQSEIDAVVDRLRKNNVSLISLHRPRLTLEDAFLQLVDESSFKN